VKVRPERIQILSLFTLVYYFV